MQGKALLKIVHFSRKVSFITARGSKLQYNVLSTILPYLNHLQFTRVRSWSENETQIMRRHYHADLRKLVCSLFVGFFR